MYPENCSDVYLKVKENRQENGGEDWNTGTMLKQHNASTYVGESTSPPLPDCGFSCNLMHFGKGKDIPSGSKPFVLP